MRQDFRLLLRELEDGHRRSEVQIHVRSSNARIPSLSRGFSVREFEQALTRYFWGLYCPELDVTIHWERQHDHVWAVALGFLISDYGPRARTRTYDLARTVVEGGLRAILTNLTERLVEDFSKRQSEKLVDDYWIDTSVETKISDARDYITAYQRLLPPEMTDGFGGPIIERFRQFLLQHAAVIRATQREITG